MPTRNFRHRRGISLVLIAILIVVLLGVVAFSVDVGYMVMVRTQLQAAADSAALAAARDFDKTRAEIVATAKTYAGYHSAAAQAIALADSDVELGIWDIGTRTFTATGEIGNAVRVTARRQNAPLFFGRVFNQQNFNSDASAVAMVNPRDIAFVVDLSGSMNDDTEPAWATNEINGKFGPQGYPDVAEDLMRDVFADFGYGTFPGTLEYVGAPLGVAPDQYAYAEMTKDAGSLTDAAMPAQYRIYAGDDEATRKQKAYRWIIDNQIARMMPGVKPAADSAVNYAYWEKYLDYILDDVWIMPPPPPPPPSPPSPPPSGGGGGGGGGTPPPPPPPPSPPPPPPAPEIGRLFPVQDAVRGFDLFAGSRGALLSGWLWYQSAPGTPPTERGDLPPNQDADRIHEFNNPNKYTFPSASNGVPRGYRNWIGYLTYVSFMMDHGRDKQPEGATFVPLSRQSPDCPLHAESTAGGTFQFPPREQPMHAARRALIAALEVVRDQNDAIPSNQYKDWVSIVTYDTITNSTPQLVQPLTGNHLDAMSACTTLQAMKDVGATTATEAGLIAARNHIKPKSEGGQGRENVDRIVVLLTDGVPNQWQTSNSAIDSYISGNSSSNFYANGAYWLDAPIMQAAKMKADDWLVYPVGLGLGTDYNFMDRLARAGGTADSSGKSPRGSGNPAEYEERLTEIFRKIIENPEVRLVQ